MDVPTLNFLRKMYSVLKVHRLFMRVRFYANKLIKTLVMHFRIIISDKKRRFDVILTFIYLFIYLFIYFKLDNDVKMTLKRR